MRGFKEEIRNLFVGFLIGIGFILPGLSGSVMAVVFGIYERVIDDISHIKTRIKEDLRFILTIGIGLLIGTILFAFLWKAIPDEYMAVALALFIGMIIGQLPELGDIVKQEGKVRPSYVGWFIVGIVVIAVIFVLEMGNDHSEMVFDNRTYMFLMTMVAGLILAAGLIPGMNGTTFLIGLGMMNLMIDPLTSFDPVMLIALGIGGLVGLLGVAKAMDGFIKRYRAPTYYVIFGLTVGSIFLIVQQMTGVDTWIDVVLCIIAVAIGLLISIAFTRYGRTKGVPEAVLDESL